MRFVGRACIAMLVAFVAMSPASVSATADAQPSSSVDHASGPVVHTARASSDHDGEGGAGFVIGRVIGTLMFGGIIALLIWSSNKRKAEQRAHDARFALPPPPLTNSPSRATLPPPSMPAPHTTPSLSDH